LEDGAKMTLIPFVVIGCLHFCSFVGITIVASEPIEEKTYDVSKEKRFTKIIGKGDSLDGRDYYLYYYPLCLADNPRPTIDGIEDERPGVRKDCTLRKGTPILIHRVLRDDLFMRGVVVSSCYYYEVSFIHPKTTKMQFAIVSPYFLKKYGLPQEK
jgi:hypothetical protein